MVTLSRRRLVATLLDAVVVGALALCFASPAGAAPKTIAQSNAPLVAAVRTELAGYLKERGAKEHLSSLSFALSYGPSQPTITVTSGSTKYGGGSAVTPTSLYQIGSNTKAFTAVAVLQLEAKGRLSIDAPIGKYLPQYPAYSKLTLRRLLNMTSGIESYDNIPSWETSYASNPMADVSTTTQIRRVYPQINFPPPGSKYHYSNTGYLLAQEVVEARSDSKSFAKEMARIISSVGLKHTFYTSHLYPADVARNVVAGYYEQDDKRLAPIRGKDITGYSLSWAQAAGSIVSTPSDLITWARALYSDSALLPAKQKAELMSMISLKTAKPLAKATADDPAGFGLGVAQRYDAGMGAFWFYQGETLGFRAAHIYFPDSGLVFAIYANSRPVQKESQLIPLLVKLYPTIKKYAPKSM